jgi:DNA-binding NtrC family response regulator
MAHEGECGRQPLGSLPSSIMKGGAEEREGCLRIRDRTGLQWPVTSEEKAGGLAVASGATDVQHRPLGKVREQAEREHIISVLRLTNGNRIQAAQILGISRKTLWKKLKHLGVSWPPTITPG